MSTPANKGLRLLKRINEFGSEFSFPDDLVVPILSSLPLEDIIRCRRVCRRWRDLISTQYFVDTLSRTRSFPPVIIATSRTGGLDADRFLLSKWWEGVPIESMIRRFNIHPPGIRRRSSTVKYLGDGIHVSNSIIFDPVYNKTVTVVLPKKLSRVISAFAIYFHPNLGEYCILWKVTSEEGGSQYMILNLGSRPCWKKIRNPWTHICTSLIYPPTLFFGRYLYWMARFTDKDKEDVIMEFDILCEELKAIYSPVYTAVKYYGYNKDLLGGTNVHLLDGGGLLFLFKICPEENIVYQWTLNREKELWTSCIYIISGLGSPWYQPFRPVALVDEHLLVQGSYILVVNLKLGTIRPLETNVCFPYAMSLSRVLSLASLKNCKSKIIIEEKDDEIIVKEN